MLLIQYIRLLILLLMEICCIVNQLALLQSISLLETVETVSVLSVRSIWYSSHQNMDFKPSLQTPQGLITHIVVPVCMSRAQVCQFTG